MNPTCLDDVVKTYRDHGHRQYGEDVTELQPALQCATFALQANEPPVVVAAALLHDYGHLCHHFGEDIADQGGTHSMSRSATTGFGGFSPLRSLMLAGCMWRQSVTYAGRRRIISKVSPRPRARAWRCRAGP